MPHARVVGVADDLLDQRLAAVVGRVRLARDDELHRAFRVQQHRAQPLRVAQHQGQPLVGGDAAGEPDGQHVRVEHRVGPAQLQRRRAALQPRRADPAADLVDQAAAQLGAQLPQPGVGDRLEPQPDPGLLGLAEHPAHLGRRPRRAVHAVGHRPDRHLGHVEAGPEAAEHVPADLAVQLRHAVRPLREPQAHVRHVEQAGVVLRAQRQHPLRAHARQQRLGAEVVLHEVHREPVDARRHRRVRREHRARPHRRVRLVEVQALGGRQLPDPLQPQEPGVPLVGVEHLGLRVPGQLAVGAHRPDPADARQDLLPDPVVLVPAVQPVGDPAQVLVVLLDVGVEQQQRDPPHLRLPDLGPQHPVARHGHVHQDRRAGRLGQQLQRKRPRVQHRVVLDLPPVERQRLPEVPGPVEQPHRDQRHPEVGRRLQVVTRQHPEPTGVVRQRLGDAELHREVRDRLRQRAQLVVPVLPPRLHLLLAPLEPPRPLRVAVEVVGQRTRVRQELLVPREHLQPLRRYLGQQPQRVATHIGPDLGVHRREEVLRRRMPGPAQVGGERAQGRQWLRQAGSDGEPAKCSHGDGPYLPPAATRQVSTPNLQRFAGSVPGPIQKTYECHQVFRVGRRGRRGCSRSEQRTGSASTGREVEWCSQFRCPAPAQPPPRLHVARTPAISGTSSSPAATETTSFSPSSTEGARRSASFRT